MAQLTNNAERQPTKQTTKYDEKKENNWNLEQAKQFEFTRILYRIIVDGETRKCFHFAEIVPIWCFIGRPRNGKKEVWERQRERNRMQRYEYVWNRDQKWTN